MEFVETGWTKEEILEAIALLRRNQTVHLFKGAVWDWRMLDSAVREEIARQAAPASDA